MSGTTQRLGVDPERLHAYMREHLEGVSEDPLEIELFGGGRSGNVTLAVRAGGRDLVLRRPPFGEYDPQAYDPTRDYRFLVALAHTDLPVPRPVTLCRDVTVIGVPFYLMERAYGRNISLPGDAPELADPARAAALGEIVVRGLARLHSVDLADVGLAEAGRPDGFVERQVRRWTSQWEERRQRDLPGLDELSRRLAASLELGDLDPVPPRPTIVHGDFNLSNLLFAPEDFTIRAILDWEQATVGHPLVDLGVTMSQNGPWHAAMIGAKSAVGELPGFPDPLDMAKIYAEATGEDVKAISFFHLLALFKILVICEDVVARHRSGDVGGEQYEHLGEKTPEICEYALEIADRSSIRGLDGKKRDSRPERRT